MIVANEGVFPKLEANPQKLLWRPECSWVQEGGCLFTLLKSPRAVKSVKQTGLEIRGAKLWSAFHGFLASTKVSSSYS